MKLQIQITFNSAVLVTILAVSPAIADWQPSNYEKRFVNSEKGVHLRDNNVWVYTSDFAERFGMPGKWADDKLEGAEAVAYRVEWSSLQKCGYFSNPNNCRPIERCVLDVYLTDADSMKLPWKEDAKQRFMHRSSSARFLTAQTQEDSSLWDPEKNRTNIYHPRIGLSSIGWVSGAPKDGKVYAASSGAVSVLAYDREIAKELDFIQLALDCGIATETHNVRIFFEEKFPNRDDYNVSYKELVEKKTPKVIRYLRYKKSWFEAHAKGHVPHTVTLPDAYMARVNEYDRKHYASKSLASEVEKRLKHKKPAKQEKSWWQKLFGIEE